MNKRINKFCFALKNFYKIYVHEQLKVLLITVFVAFLFICLLLNFSNYNQKNKMLSFKDLIEISIYGPLIGFTFYLIIIYFIDFRPKLKKYWKEVEMNSKYQKLIKKFNKIN